MLICRTRLWNVNRLVVRINITLNTPNPEWKKTLECQRDYVAFIDLEWWYNTSILQKLKVLLEGSSNVLDRSVTADDAQQALDSFMIASLEDLQCAFQDIAADVVFLA